MGSSCDIHHGAFATVHLSGSSSELSKCVVPAPEKAHCGLLFLCPSRLRSCGRPRSKRRDSTGLSSALALLGQSASAMTGVQLETPASWDSGQRRESGTGQMLSRYVTVPIWLRIGRRIGAMRWLGIVVPGPGTYLFPGLSKRVLSRVDGWARFLPGHGALESPCPMDLAT